MSAVSTPANPPMIDMRHVVCASMRDRRTVVAREVNWRVAAGDYWVIAGLQGAGKTDLLMMTAGLMPPQSGEYRFLGEPMPIFDDARLQHRLRLGFVFDGGQLLNHLTVRENIALPLRYHRNLDEADAEPVVLKYLEVFELEKIASSTPGSIGRNWQKRVGLARALILGPELLLLDNPLGGLDPRHAFWWLNLLNQLSRGHELTDNKPVTLVLTASDLRPWRARARQFAFLQDKVFYPSGSWQEASTAQADRVKDFSEEEP